MQNSRDLNVLNILYLWGASCCVILSHFPNIPAIATEILVTLFLNIVTSYVNQMPHYAYISCSHETHRRRRHTCAYGTF
jgi:hypothetical protein